MAEIKPNIETLANIKVIGAGGSGGSTINQMVRQNIRGVEFIAINADAQALHHSLASVKLHIGKATTRGLGAGMDPEVGRKAAEESQNEIREAIKGADMVFVTCGLGGGTGTGSSPLIAEVARDSGALTVAVVTRPFSFEGAQRRSIAERGLKELSEHVDAIITIPNDRVLEVVDKKVSMIDAFSVVNDVLAQGVQGIAELITVSSDLTNVDFADVKSVMRDAGSALMGIGRGSGENRAAEAAKAAITNPLVEVTIDGARGILFNIIAGPDFGMHELQDAAKIVVAQADQNAKIIYGTVIDESMKDEVRITVIATGFGDKTMPSSSVASIDDATYRSSSGLFARRVEKTPDPKPARRGELALEDEEERASQKRDDEGDEPEDELDIPAFIRKKMS